MTPLVSIITPAYNHAPFIGRCIRSVLGQTFAGWEQIIIDDGSTDNTACLAASFGDGRIKCVRQENKGVFRLAESYNRALGMARGDFIAVLEGDDAWPPDKLETQLGLFGSGDCVLSWGFADVIDRNDRRLGVIPAPHKMPDFRGDQMNYLLVANPIPAVTVMARRAALLSIGGFRQPAGVPYVDYPTWLALAMEGEFRFVNKILGQWRTHGAQVTAGLDVAMVRRMNDCLVSVFDSLGPERKRGLSLTRRDILRNNERNIASASLRRGRIEMLKSNWKKSRFYTWQSLRAGTARIRLWSALSILSSYVHLDMEFLARLLTGDYIAR
ncbi:MAG: glycosyltransferase [Nitrospiraceae bacterium]|nr:glycosyltransferase [Nitrospiraceae bacterium]